MIQLSIKEAKIQNFFNNSKEEMLKALEFIVDNDIKYFDKLSNEAKLTIKQKKELNSRIESFHKNPNIGKTWDEIKSTLNRNDS